MPPLSPQRLPAVDALKMFELGVTAATCQEPAQLQALLESFFKIFPIHAAVCGIVKVEPPQTGNGTPTERQSPNIDIPAVYNAGWPEEFLRFYLGEKVIERDGQFFTWLKSQYPTLWLDVYEKQKHSFNPWTKQGIDPKFVEFTLDCDLRLALRFGQIESAGLQTGGYLKFHTRREAHRFSPLIQAMVPHLHNAMMRCYKRSTEGQTDPGPGIQLGPRESEVLKWLIEGKSNWEISMILHISVNTVKFHLKNLMHKFNAMNRYQLVANAMSGQGVEKWVKGKG
jgi:DNA-binding CsgD family transcriptional regulator